jgi:hypothetical protein
MYPLLYTPADLVRGDRPGALIAGTWAAMQYMGQESVALKNKSFRLTKKL